MYKFNFKHIRGMWGERGKLKLDAFYSFFYKYSIFQGSDRFTF
jgi:hypothetical protein